MKISFDNKNILVTGGARGLGEACARKLSEAGGRVAIADIDFDAVRADSCNRLHVSADDFRKIKKIDHLRMLFLLHVIREFEDTLLNLSARCGSMHLCDPVSGNIGSNGIVGGGIPLATGAVWA